jgi:glucokinase
MGRAAGIDVGGTKCLGIVLDDAGEVLVEHRVPSPDDPKRLIHTLAELAGGLGAYDSLGIGLPGLVTRSGVLRAAPNLGLTTDLAVGSLLAERLGHPVRVDNDATCATKAEWLLGAGRGCDEVLLVALGTGIGGGIVAGGALQRGENGFAGEIGHMVVDPDGPPCPCGRRGCWERYASGSGLAMLAGGRRGEDVVAAARAGDAESAEVLERYAWWVALGLVNLTNLLDPGVIVLAGGLVASADVLGAPVQRAFDELIYAPSQRPRPRLLAAELGPRAGAIGAALLGRD